MKSLKRVRSYLSPAAVLVGLGLLVAGGGAAAQDAARGRELLARYQCGQCHVIPGVPAARGRFAVTLKDFGRRSYIAGRVANLPDTLALWIRHPQAVVPGTAMPDMGADERDARDMAAYLGQLQ